jgi:hypothetical protein
MVADQSAAGRGLCRSASGKARGFSSPRMEGGFHPKIDEHGWLKLRVGKGRRSSIRSGSLGRNIQRKDSTSSLPRPICVGYFPIPRSQLA